MESSRKTDFLERDGIFPLILKMGIPAAVGMLVNALYNVVDTIFVGRGVGPLAIAALAIVFPLQMLVSSFAQAIGFGAASIVSRRLGEKRGEEAAAAIGTAYTAVAVSTLALVAILFAFMRPILMAFGASEATIPYAMDYLSIVAAGFFFFSMSMAANGLVRAEGNARASMVGMVLGAALNCVLDPLFIFVFHWGVKGAAIATVISQIASCAYLFSIYAFRRSHVSLRFAHLRIRRDLLKESAILGVPAFMQEAGMSVLALVINNTLVAYGGDQAITIYGMVNRFQSLIFLPMLGMIQGFQPIAGYNFGARRFDRVRKSLRVAIATAVSMAALGYVFTVLLPALSMSLFTRDAALIAASARVLRIISSLLPLIAVQIIGSTYFQAVGKPRPSLILGLSRQFIILIPLLLVLPRFLGLDGVWAAFPLSDFLATAMTVTFLILDVRRLESVKIETSAA
jgi:putative MATE family efflux protein